MAEKEDFDYADVDHIGTYRKDDSFDDRQIEAVLALRPWSMRRRSASGCGSPASSPRVEVTSCRRRHPAEAPRPTGRRLHHPQWRGQWRLRPQSGAAGEESRRHHGRGGKQAGYDLGTAPSIFPPTSNRLAFIQEDGKATYGEEYTLAQRGRRAHPRPRQGQPPSPTSALHAPCATSPSAMVASVLPSAVGEVNVTTKMKEVRRRHWWRGQRRKSIYPESHYGLRRPGRHRPLPQFAGTEGIRHVQLSSARRSRTHDIAKNRIDLTPDTDMDAILGKVKERFGFDRTTRASRILMARNSTSR